MKPHERYEFNADDPGLRDVETEYSLRDTIRKTLCRYGCIEATLLRINFLAEDEWRRMHIDA